MESSAIPTMHDVDATTLHTWLQHGEALLVDVREPPEYAAEHIPEALLVPLSTFQPAQIPQEAGKKIVLHCVMGKRSEQAGQKLLDAGFATVYNFRGGVQAWKNAGYATAHDAAPRTGEATQHPVHSRQQQMCIAASVLVLLGTVLLGAVASGWFLLLSGAVGMGLVYAGMKPVGG
jgi:rhodanese-related sulfurtransferase